MRCQRLICGVGQEKLQQQSLLERAVVVIGDDEDDCSLGRPLNCNTFIVFGSKGLLELQQLFSHELGSRSQIFAFDQRHAADKMPRGK
jgi:hypothetical protein